MKFEETKTKKRYNVRKSTIDLAGSGAEYATPEEMKRLLDKLRKEDV
ncbi:MAG: hypothetical protein QXQ94_07870 [Candidatus Bathyarchaeia archaeon]